MSGELEAVGAMATAGLAASTLEHDGAHGKGHGACANCGTALLGDYCHVCGQVGHLHRSMLHIVEEFFHGILHFDSKAWHTLPLLVFRPGRLTRDYIHGHRVRYVTPLALFLFTAFLMFMIFSMLGGGSKPEMPATADQAQARAELLGAVEEAKADLAAAEQELAEAQSGEGSAERAQRRREKASHELTGAEMALRIFDEAVTKGTQGKPLPPDVKTGMEGLSTLAGQNLNIDIGYPTLEAKIKQKLKNPDLLLYKLQNTAYKFSWMLIPISLPFLWLLFFWRRDVAMYDHAIFALYSLSFMSLLFITISLLHSSGYKFLADIGSLLAFAPPVHMYFHLKGTYALTRAQALWRTVALLIITAMTSTLFVLFIISLGFTG